MVFRAGLPNLVTGEQMNNLYKRPDSAEGLTLVQVNQYYEAQFMEMRRRGVAAREEDREGFLKRWRELNRK